MTSMPLSEQRVAEAANCADLRTGEVGGWVTAAPLSSGGLGARSEGKRGKDRAEQDPRESNRAHARLRCVCRTDTYKRRL